MNGDLSRLPRRAVGLAVDHPITAISLQFLLTGKITGETPADGTPNACETSIPWAFYDFQSSFVTGDEQGGNRGVTGKEQGTCGNRRHRA